jgi:hypothetical protein
MNCKWRQRQWKCSLDRYWIPCAGCYGRHKALLLVGRYPLTSMKLRLHVHQQEVAHLPDYNKFDEC